MSAPKLTAWQRRASKVSGLRAEYLTRPKFDFKRKAGMPFFVPAAHLHEHWPVGLPLSGGHDGGYRVGVAMARALLTFYARGGLADGRPPGDALRLWWVVHSLARRADAARARCAGSRLSASIDPARLIRECTTAEAQFFGFVEELQRWIVAAVPGFADALGKVSDAELVTLAEAGLGYDEVAACQPFALARNRAKRPRATKGKGGES